MYCPNCQQEFNAELNLPRILIFCGHTYCHQCIEALLEKAKESVVDYQSGPLALNCPECQTQNQAHDGTPNAFPKNLVLLQVNTYQQNNPQQQNSVQSLNQSSSFQQVQVTNKEQQKESTRQSQSAQQLTVKQQPAALCSQHGKKLEAFCEKDLQTLCIDCILSEQHKSHEIVSIQKAVEKQKQQLYEEVQISQKTEERLKFITSDIKRHIGEIHSQAEKNRKELSSIYSYVRELLLEREQALKRQISENLQKEEQDSQIKLQEINEYINKISVLKQELVNQSQECEIEVLNKAKARQQLCNEANGQKTKEMVAFNIINMSNQSQSLMEIRRDQELAQISKITNPSYKGPATVGGTIGSSQPNSQQQSSSTTLYSHTMASKMKRAGTMNQPGSTLVQPQQTPALTSNISNPPSNQVGSYNCQIDEIRKSGKMKSKVSPHRQQTASKKSDLVQSSVNKSKQGGIVVLDQQNKQKYPSSTHNKLSNKSNNQYPQQPISSFANVASQQINLFNQNNNINGLGNETSEDGIITGMGADEVSSIYPLETHDYYYQYSPKNGQLRNGVQDFIKQSEIKRDESVGALNDLLESLNKSGNENIQSSSSKDLVNRKSSTASETQGSDANGIVKSNIETPKSKKMNPWTKQNQRQRSKSGNKKSLKKDHSATDFEEFKNAQCKIPSPHKSSINQQLDNDKLRSGSLQRCNSNSIVVNACVVQLRPCNGEYEDEQKGSKNFNMLSLSQERNKRKQKKQDAISRDASPFKNNFNSPEKEQEREQLLVMLQECTKSIEKIELKPKSAKKKQRAIELNIGSVQSQDSPNKYPNGIPSSQSKLAAICLVDLTSSGPQEESNLRLNHIEDEQAIIKNEEGEETKSKKVPNNSNSHKDSSPYKQSQTFDNNSEQQQHQNSVSSPFKDSQVSQQQQKQILSSNESLDQLLGQFNRKSDNVMSSISSSNQLQQNYNGQSNVSIDTSVSDPFRALCRMKEEFIFVFSGFNEQKLLICEALDVQRGVWKEISQIGKARTKFSAVPISKSRILLFGGKLADGQRTGEIEEYNLKTNKFKLLPFKLPKPRSGFAACVKREEGKIFFCGGNSGSVLKKFDCLDLKKGKWSRWPEMLQKRDELAVALGPDGKIYAIGGYGGGSNNQTVQSEDKNGDSKSNQGSNCLRTAERFDFNTGQWEMLPEMNEARRALAAVALPDGIYAIGGYDGKQYLSSVEKFDLQKQQWVTVKSMNTSRCTLSAVTSSDCQYIYALGGFNGNSLDLVERYNIMTDEWEFMTPMNSKRFMHEAVCLITH